jgi:3-phenylpropionate/trans-cinnamate dioxygenase ferredoxin reductase subunit
MAETIVILGAGHGGCQLADSLRAGGFAGDILLVGDEPHAPYDRPPISKQLLTDDRAVEPMFLRRPGFYDEHRVVTRLSSRATAIDRKARRVALSNGQFLDYDRLVIATGASARKLPLPGADRPGVFYLRSLDDALAIRAKLVPGARVAIIGGGYVGLEVAASAVKRGCKPLIVETENRLLARVLDEQVAAFFEREHRAAGVEIILGSAVRSFQHRRDHLSGITLADGREYDADLAIVAIGAMPNVSLAEQAGLLVENGIVVDEYCQTSDPNIYAIGDATNHPNPLLGKRLRLESVPAAIGQARAAASAICGKPQPYAEIPWFWSDQFDLKLQIVGLSEPGDQLVMRGDPNERHFAAFHLRDSVIVSVSAVNAPRDVMIAKKFILEKRKVDPARLADPELPLLTA